LIFWPFGVTLPPDSKMLRRRASAGGLSVAEAVGPVELLLDAEPPEEPLLDVEAPEEPLPGVVDGTLLADGGVLAELLADAEGGAAAVSGALVQPASTRKSPDVTAAVAGQRGLRARPSVVGGGVLSVVSLVLTCSLISRSVLVPHHRTCGAERTRPPTRAGRGPRRSG
jgi:hypothetical protein